MNVRKDREQIRAWYTVDKLSTVEIGKRIGRTPSAVGSILRHLGIPLRPISEQLKVQYPKGRFGANAGHWKGGKRHYSKGYIGIHIPDHPYASKEGYVMEHRLVMEEILGRYLLPSEMVHHKNRNKADNRPENLELVASHKDHSHKYFNAGRELDELPKKIMIELETNFQEWDDITLQDIRDSIFAVTGQKIERLTPRDDL